MERTVPDRRRRSILPPGQAGKGAGSGRRGRPSAAELAVRVRARLTAGRPPWSARFSPAAAGELGGGPAAQGENREQASVGVTFVPCGWCLRETFTTDRATSRMTLSQSRSAGWSPISLADTFGRSSRR